MWHDVTASIPPISTSIFVQADVSVLNERGDMFKHRLQEGTGWEMPRPPFEVTFIRSLNIWTENSCTLELLYP